MAKYYDTRRTEIIATAQQLFFSRGFDSVSIADIIRAVGIAKGTFYHYFASKDELLEGIIDVYTERVIAHIEPISADRNRSARERLGEYFREAFFIKAQSPEMLRLGLEQMYRAENTLLRIRMVDRSVTVVAPHLATMIRDGNRQGEFSVPDPENCAEFIYRGIAAVSEQMATGFLNPQSASELFAEVDRLLTFFEWSLGRLLGLQGDPVRIADREDLRTMIEAFSAMEASA